MATLHPVRLRPEVLRALVSFKSSTLDMRSVDDLVNDLLLLSLAQSVGTQGYQWNKVFLPDGSKVRIRAAGQYETAHVVGDRLLFRDAPTTPHRFAECVAGEGRNVWRVLWIWRPMDTHWRPAESLRRGVGV